MQEILLHFNLNVFCLNKLEKDHSQVYQDQFFIYVNNNTVLLNKSRF